MRNSRKLGRKEVIEVGRITKPFGIKGEVIAVDYAKDIEQFVNFDYFYIPKVISEKNQEEILVDRFIVENLRGSTNKIILKLGGVDSRNDSEMLVKKSLYVLKSDIVLDENEYLFQDLIGCACYYDGKKFGRILSMPNHGTCDMFEIKLKSDSNDVGSDSGKSKKNNTGKVVNIPYYKELIEKIDIEEKIVYFNEGHEDYL